MLGIEELKDYNNKIDSFNRVFEDIDYNLFNLSIENYYHLSK